MNDLTLTPELLTPKVLARFWRKVDRRSADECWEWQVRRRSETNGPVVGASRVHGRITLTQDGVSKTFYAHRLAYVIAFGSIEPGRLVCHHCDNPPCCNPAHLYAGTFADNADDRERRGRSGSSSVVRVPASQRMAIEADYIAGVPWRTIAQNHGISMYVLGKILHIMNVELGRAPGPKKV